MSISLDTSLRRRILEFLLGPILRFALRHSYGFQELVNLSRELYVRYAAEEIRQKSSKVNVSRIAVLTGLSRPEVTRLFKFREAPVEQPKLLYKVVGQWRSDPRFCSAPEQPRLLTCDGEGSEFHTLVSSVNKSIHPGTIQFELERIGAIEKRGNKLRLAKQMLGLNKDLAGGFGLVGKDIDALVRACEGNLQGNLSIDHHHMRTEYDNISKRHLPEIRRWIVLEGKDFHRRMREYLSKHDKDINPDLADSEGGGRVAVGSFCFAEPIEDE